jgi:hypothetical protein
MIIFCGYSLVKISPIVVSFGVWNLQQLGSRLHNTYGENIVSKAAITSSSHVGFMAIILYSLSRNNLEFEQKRVPGRIRI